MTDYYGESVVKRKKKDKWIVLFDYILLVQPGNLVSGNEHSWGFVNPQAFVARRLFFWCIQNPSLAPAVIFI
jgi:hypothetical protein